MEMIDVFAIHDEPMSMVTILENGNQYTKNLNVGNSISIPKYYLGNKDTVNEKGEIRTKGTEPEYRWIFSVKLKKLDPIEVGAFLDTHYTASVNKNKFVDILESVVLGRITEPEKEPTRYFINKWLAKLGLPAIPYTYIPSKEPHPDTQILLYSREWTDRYEKDVEESASKKEIQAKPQPLIIKPTSFQEIFTVPDWNKYIDALHQVEDPIIDSNYVFIGSSKGHKGVIGNWINELQTKGKIHKDYKRQMLAVVLNNEIKGLNMGLDGGVIEKLSYKYSDYRENLLKKVNLLP